MHALSKAFVLMAAVGLGQAANAACYQVYAPDNTVVYRSYQPPVDLSKPLHTTMPLAAPGGSLVFALDPSGCQFEMDKLDTLHSIARAQKRSTRPARRGRTARAARGA